jgi:ABC-type transport system involved in cytochrome c biogenesis permease subunit
MATPQTISPVSTHPVPSAVTARARLPWEWWLAPLASLKLTVALFLASIFIVLIGTLAQVDKDIWEVIHEYFRVDFRQLVSRSAPWLNLKELGVWIDPKIFFPPAFFPAGGPSFPAWLGFWFPKGWVIGFVMLLNLFAAHLIRFKIQARGARLWIGWGIILLGALVTLAVILGGSSTEGLQAKPFISYRTFWWLMQTSLFGLCAVSIYAAASADPHRNEQRWLFGILAALLGLASIAAFRMDGTNESTLRILYQVMQATFAGLVLLAGCIAVFKKRAGIVLLHAGIGLMMSYDVLVGLEHVESQMHITEGEATSFSRDMREPELAIIDHSAADTDQVTVISGRLFQHAGADIKDSKLPFEIKVLEYYPNSTILGPRQPLPEGVPEKNPATAGLGKQIRAVPITGASGTDTDGRIDVPSAYLELLDKSGKSLGTWLVSSHFDVSLEDMSEPVTVDGKTYDIALRFRRIYNPYTITLKDVQKNDYKGTDRPKDYSSFVELKDPSRQTQFEHRIWMNNPMRYAGKTFYQSNYARTSDGEVTTLQVVDNAGWMTPYVACMMVVVGMLYHFGQTLVRYLHRRLRSISGAALETDLSDETTLDTTPHPRDPWNRIGWAVTAVLVASVAVAVGTAAMPKPAPATDFHIAQFGELPMWYKGRPMPIDTFARNTLMQFSDYQSFKNSEGKSQPAVRWLLDLMADEQQARQYQIVKIESDDVRASVGLERREKFLYSIDELNGKIDKIIEQASAANKIPAKERSLVQRKTLELANKLIFYSFLERTLGQAPELPKPEETKDKPGVQQLAARAQEYFEFLRTARGSIQQFTEQFGLGPLPLIVPTHLGVETEQRPDIEELNSKWEPLTIAEVYDQFYGEFPAPTPPAIAGFVAMLKSYRDGDVAGFNRQLDTYQQLLAKHASADDLPVAKVDFEAWYNHFGGFNLCSWLYVFAFVLAILGWLMLPQIFERSAFWLTVLIFAVHTAALVGRIYISGRPPVTNLYSSAVFIGWAVVLGGLIIECLTRLGLGTVVATAVGFLTLRIAHGLAADGDTFVVLEAVLDTQFWLATHVVCITLGYATTYMAGMCGLLYTVLGVMTPKLRPSIGKELTRMTYGIICFALFFSFWGTVLGGLWADDSWGRFWGWDPKENGALIIVLWNALVLHARWGGMVRDRGLAVLAVLGNIVVSWSWFGVNELGVGLHSYGFTEGRLKMLAMFVLLQLAIAAIGCIPRQYWWSSRLPGEPHATA